MTVISPSVVEALVAETPELGQIVEFISGGLSGAAVVKVENEQAFEGVRILKVQNPKCEAHFLTHVAPALFHQANWLPRVYAHGDYDQANWLLMEYVPNEFPYERGNTDLAALKVLRELHTASVSDMEYVEEGVWDSQLWTRDQLDAVEKYLPHATFKQLKQVHEFYLQRREVSKVICSGDPNLPNWRVRENGELVLLDWQLITLDHVALDLAGWVTTLLSYEELTTIARAYTGEDDVSELAADFFVYCCRRWATNFWRAEQSEQAKLWAKSNEWMAEVLPKWVDDNIACVGL